MNDKGHKNATLLVGVLFLASLLINLIQLFIHNPKSFIEMFTSAKEMGLPWIPYISITTIFFSALGAVGLMKHKQWGFYGIYLSYLSGVSVVWFPFFPDFIFQFTSGVFKSIIILTLLLALLGFLIYLHVIGKKRLYFKKSRAI